MTTETELRRLATVVLAHFEPRRENQAPGHCHSIAGVWDEDNGALAGKPCEWCATWKSFKAALAAPQQVAGKGETPRVAEAQIHLTNPVNGNLDLYVNVHLARRLERELAAAQTELSSLRAKAGEAERDAGRLSHLIGHHEKNLWSALWDGSAGNPIPLNDIRAAIDAQIAARGKDGA